MLCRSAFDTLAAEIDWEEGGYIACSRERQRGVRGRKGGLFKNWTGVIPAARPNSLLRTQRVCLLQACVSVCLCFIMFQYMFHSNLTAALIPQFVMVFAPR